MEGRKKSALDPTLSVQRAEKRGAEEPACVTERNVELSTALPSFVLSGWHPCIRGLQAC